MTVAHRKLVHRKFGINVTMGTGVVLFVIGAILGIAVHVQTAFISLSTVGVILMAAGIVVFLIGLVLALRGRRSVTTTTAATPDAGVAAQRTTRTSDPTDFWQSERIRQLKLFVCWAFAPHRVAAAKM